MKSDECGNEGRRNSLEITAEFCHRYITAQIHFVNTFTQEPTILD